MRLRSVEPGFDPAPVLTFHLALPEATHPAPADAARVIGRALDAIAAVPGVQAVGVVSKLPLEGEEQRRDTGLFVEDRPTPPGTMPRIHQVSYVSAGFFQALGIPLVAGRPLDRLDPDVAPLDVLVSRAFAERYWKGESAIGKRIRIFLTGPWYTIVGVVDNVRGTTLEQPPDEMIYSPIVTPAADTRWRPRDMTFVVRAGGDPTLVAGPIRAVIRTIDPALPVFRVRPMTEVVAGAAARTSFTLLLLGLASAVALAIGAIGIYGVLSYVVTLRTREIALRLALGAQAPDVRWMVSRQGIALTSIGILVGLGAALVATRALAALLYEISPMDAAALGAATATLFLVALVASWLPACRAARVDPVRALRME
jgi:predicted permease